MFSLRQCHKVQPGRIPGRIPTGESRATRVREQLLDL